MTRLRWITCIHISFLIGVTHSHFSVENLGSSSSASTHSTVVDCGTASPTDDERIEMSQVFEQWLERNADRNLRIMSLTYVPVYFHVLKPNDRVGSVSSKVVNRFLTRLNLKMQNTPFIFELFDIEEVIEPNWAECDQEDMFKSALRRGGVESLNVYFCDLIKSRNMAGMTYLPPVSIDYSYLDGIVRTVMSVLSWSRYSFVLYPSIGHLFPFNHDTDADEPHTWKLRSSCKPDD